MDNKMEKLFLRDCPEMIKQNNKLLNYLYTSGFFDAPASSKYHLNYPGGLAEHSFNVFTELDKMTKFLHLVWERPESPFIVGWFHDLCKVDAYKATPGGEAPYEWNKRQLLSGHGAKSVMILSTLMQLTEEEMLCIRYHMGAYEKDDWDGFDMAIRKYPNVLYTHTADMLASKVDES